LLRQATNLISDAADGMVPRPSRRPEGGCRNDGRTDVRIQSWFPFQVRVGLNGRQWLYRQLEQRGVPFRKRNNVLLSVDDPRLAQELLDGQRRTHWPTPLGNVVQPIQPLWTYLQAVCALALERHLSLVAKFNGHYRYTTKWSHMSEFVGLGRQFGQDVQGGLLKAREITWWHRLALYVKQRRWRGSAADGSGFFFDMPRQQPVTRTQALQTP
jgi:hypothetical protein